MLKNDEDKLFENRHLFEQKIDVVHFGLGLLVGTAVVIIVAYEKIVY